jgi:solute carrier family 25 (mitochondrial phosphate transporter), member 23/24/25/41
MPDSSADAHLLALAGGGAGAAARTLVAPLDRVKLLAQVSKASPSPLASSPSSLPQKSPPPWRAVLALARSEGPAALWRGNAASCLRAVPYSATQLAVHDALKRAATTGGDRSSPPSPAARLAAGAAAGCAATAVAHPLDLLRLRMALPGPGPPRFGATLRGILVADGPRGLFQGLGTALTAAAPFSALHLASFDALSAAARARRARRASGSGDSPAPPHPLESVGLGAAAGGLALTALYPLDTLRRRTQMPGRAQGSGLVEAARRVLAGGVGGLYRGWGAAVLKIAPQSGARFALYEAAKDWLGVERRATDT